MRTILPLLLLAVCAPVRAAFNDFQSNVRSSNIKPFALDLGGVLGAASVDSGRSLGFPGFEAGVVSGLQFRPDRDDTILRDSNVKTFGVPLLQGSVGLPGNVALTAHGIKAGGVSVLGGGARFGLFKAPAVGALLPTAGLSFFADRFSHKYFTGEHYGANVSAGWALPLITPFATAGYDLTKVKVEAATSAGVVGQSAWSRGTRFGVGADITPLPFMRLRGAYEMLHGLPGATLDLLVKF